MATFGIYARNYIAGQGRYTPTGRIADDKPALQNIPLSTEEAKRIRETFLPWPAPKPTK